MSPIHLESPSPPVACRPSARDLGSRIDEWQALNRRFLVRREHAPEGALLRYRREPGVEEALRRLAHLEGECCPFPSLDLSNQGELLVVSVSGPPETAPILEALLGEEVAG